MTSPLRQLSTALDLDLPQSNKSIAAGSGRISWWYTELADLMLADPTMKLAELAKRLNRGVPWISLTRNSDAFKAYYAKRRAELQDARTLALKEKMLDVAEAGLSIMADRMSGPGKAALPLALVADVTEKSLAALGYGAKSAPPTAVQVNVNQQVVSPVSASELAEARNALREREFHLGSSADRRAPEILVSSVGEAPQLAGAVEPTDELLELRVGETPNGD